MALTDLQTIRKIIISEQAFIPNIFNEKIQIGLYNKSQLQHVNITQSSESVKIIMSNTPVLDAKNPIALNSNIVYPLSSSKIVWDTVVVANNLSLSIIYVENKDFFIDYFSGTIERSSINSSITNGQQVYVWYLPFVLLNSGNDYNIDYITGEISRRSGTTVPNKATLYVDYTHAQNLPSDTTINELIIEMENWLLPRLKPPYSLNSSDLGLKAASTNYVLYLFCLQASLNELLIAGKDTSDDLSKQWIALSDKYSKVSINLFSKYINVSSLPTGGVIENRFVKNRYRTKQSPSVSPGKRRH